MGKICFFGNPQGPLDEWARLERELRGEYSLHGIPQEILSASVERMRKIWNRCMDCSDDDKLFSCPFTPIVPRSAEELSALKSQIETFLQQECYPRYIAHFLTAAMFELEQAEAELFRLRKELGE